MRVEPWTGRMDYKKRGTDKWSLKFKTLLLGRMSNKKFQLQDVFGRNDAAVNDDDRDTGVAMIFIRK